MLHEEEMLSFVVADGAGGFAGGDKAAEMTNLVLWSEPRVPMLDELIDAARKNDLDVDLDPIAGETTLIQVVVSDGLVRGCSVGDSQAWIVRDFVIDRLTGQQNRRPFHGSGRAKHVAFERQLGDGTLICGSDGVFNYIPRDVIVRSCELSDLEKLVDTLLHNARLGSGALQDDFCLLVCRMTG